MDSSKSRSDAAEPNRQLQEHAAKPHTNTQCAIECLPSISEAPNVIPRTTYIAYFILY